MRLPVLMTANRNFGSWKILRRVIATVAVFLSVFAVARAETPLQFAESSLIIHTARGDHPFAVEMAENDAQRSRGLMFRRELADDRGMLFDFKRDIFISMWMRNTLIPLDMLFISANGRISYIRENTVPYSLDIIEAPDRNRAVLEVSAGTVARLGIRVGDRVAHPIFR